MTAERTPPNGTGGTGANEPLDSGSGPDVELWTALLGKWMDFARASVAFSKDAEGDTMRAAVGPLIALHATICALGEIETIPKSRRALAVDVAGVQIGQQERILAGLWSGVSSDGKPRAMPMGVAELIAEAHQAHRAAGAQVAGG